MSDNSKIEWTDASWNAVTGCTKVSPGCDHCLVPETRVLRADMTWVPIDQIQVGDKLVSFTESPDIGQNRVWEEAVVEAKFETVKPVVEIELANGARFIASEDHRWLIAQRGASAWWRQTIGLNFKTSVRTIRCEPAWTDCHDYMQGYVAGVTAGDGTFRWDPAWRSDKLGDPQSYWRVAKPERDRVVLDRLVRYLADMGITVEVRPFDAGTSGFTETPLPMMKVETRKLADMPRIALMCEERQDREWMAGWLAGMFDTDASYCGGSLRFCQSKPNNVLERAQRYAKELGFDVEPEHFENAACPTARLMGGIAENIAFLGAISPALARRCRDFYGKRLETPASPVVGIRRGPARRLIDITTSTRTFIAEGALTHNCYAETFAERWRGTPGHHFEQGFDVRLWPDRLEIPLRWKRPRRIFVNSMSDLFHEAVPDGFIAEVFAVMATCPQHTFQVLTKRHGRMRSLLNSEEFIAKVRRAVDVLEVRQEIAAMGAENIRPVTGYPGYSDVSATQIRNIGRGCQWATDVEFQWPIPGVWLGVSAEDQKWADIRIPALLDTPAAVRFVSAEPLLGPVSLDRYLWFHGPSTAGPFYDYAGRRRGGGGIGGSAVTAVRARDLHWVIIGGESGAGAREMELEWARRLAWECREAEVPAFVKQLGSVLGRQLAAGSKGGNINRWPEDLRVREFPRTAEEMPV